MTALVAPNSSKRVAAAIRHEYGSGTGRDPLPTVHPLIAEKSLIRRELLQPERRPLQNRRGRTALLVHGRGDWLQCDPCAAEIGSKSSVQANQGMGSRRLCLGAPDSVHWALTPLTTFKRSCSYSPVHMGAAYKRNAGNTWLTESPSPEWSKSSRGQRYRADAVCLPYALRLAHHVQDGRPQ